MTGAEAGQFIGSVFAALLFISVGCSLFQLVRRLGYGWFAKGVAFVGAANGMVCSAALMFPGGSYLVVLLGPISYLIWASLLGVVAFGRWPITKRDTQDTLADTFT